VIGKRGRRERRWLWGWLYVGGREMVLGGKDGYERHDGRRGRR